MTQKETKKNIYIYIYNLDKRGKKERKSKRHREWETKDKRQIKGIATHGYRGRFE